MEKPICKDCAFYAGNPYQKSGEPESGECRYNPPKVFVMTGQHPVTGQPMVQAQPLVPAVSADFWCGQHQPDEFWEPEVPSEVDEGELLAKIRAGHTPSLDEARRFQVSDQNLEQGQ